MRTGKEKVAWDSKVMRVDHIDSLTTSLEGPAAIQKSHYHLWRG